MAAQFRLPGSTAYKQRVHFQNAEYVGSQYRLYYTVSRGRRCSIPDHHHPPAPMSYQALLRNALGTDTDRCQDSDY